MNVFFLLKLIWCFNTTMLKIIDMVLEQVSNSIFIIVAKLSLMCATYIVLRLDGSRTKH
jgi:hypothetical protein